MSVARSEAQTAEIIDLESVLSWPGGVGSSEYFEYDPNPVFIVNQKHLGTNHVELTYTNKVLRRTRLYKSIVSALVPSHTSTTLPFDRDLGYWLKRQCSPQKGEEPQSILFENYVWCACTTQAGWLIVRGILLPFNARGRHHDVTVSSRTSEYALSTNGRASTVRCFMSEPLSMHQAFIRDFCWSDTPLGVMNEWDSQLLETVSLTLTNTDPAAVFWGSHMTSVYNEAFITIAGRKHPGMMGDSPANAFAEVWDGFFEPRIQISRQTREPFSEKALCLMLERLGYPEETFMDFTFLPLLGFSAEVVGFYHTVTEVTHQILSKRRMSLLLHVSEILSRAEDLETFWQLLLDSLSDSELDTPFISLYSVSTTVQEPAKQGELDETHKIHEMCHLEGFLGYATDHPALPRSFPLEDDNSLLAPIFRASLQSRGTTTLKLVDNSLPKVLVDDLQTRGHGSTSNTVLICPLQPTNHDAALGFFSVGLSSCRPYDADYQSFINLLVKNICSSLASVVLLEDEKRRGLNQAERAAYESAQLTARLKQREFENQVQEHKFMTVLQQVPVGILDLTPEGAILLANHAWYDLTTFKGTNTGLDSWVDVIHKGDLDLWRTQWTTVCSRQQSVSFETRLAVPWRHRDDDMKLVEFTWILVRMSPILDDDNCLRNITASFTDISFQKYTIAQSIRLAQDAVEAKRQQDNFIDMTSHEMRNPLNAMLLCARELCLALESLLNGDASSPQRTVLTSSLDAATTIVYCGQHQLRIIDDILTLSKLDARLLDISPIEVQPIVMVQDMLKLFDREAGAQGINMQLEVRESMKRAEYQKILLDPSRVVQILVNFIANAIKHTKTEERRELLISVGASSERPDESSLASNGIRLVNQSDFYQDPAKLKTWRGGDPVHLDFTVRDTGSGISQDDILLLFHRFAQTRPKTHAHYGGSGLGLFISQRLAELQGGRVGVASQLGVGSSFYFYIKAERCLVDKAADSMQTLSLQGSSSNQPSNEPTLSAQFKDEGVRILIVEDNLVNQKVLKRQLERLGYAIDVANHGSEALDIIYKSKWWKESEIAAPLHVILMDIEMPVMDGREAMKRIREYEQQGLLTSHIPVIALTANARAEQILNAKQCGFDDVITKPFQIQQVVNRIKILLT